MDVDLPTASLSYANAVESNVSTLPLRPGKVSLGVFNNRTGQSENALVLVCSYGDLNCSVQEFLSALKSKNLLSSVWGVTGHFSKRQFEFALHSSAFLTAKISVKGCVLRFLQKFITKVHVLVQNIPIGILRNGCSNAITVLGEHLAKGRGKFETSYC